MQTQTLAGPDQAGEGSLLGLAGVALLVGGAAAMLGSGFLFPATVGALVGIIAWFRPDLVGGGDAITQNTLIGAVTLSAVPAVLLLRFALGSLSYAAQTPGDGRRSKVVSETWTSVESSAADRNQDRQPIPKACLDPGL